MAVLSISMAAGRVTNKMIWSYNLQLPFNAALCLGLNYYETIFSAANIE